MDESVRALDYSETSLKRDFPVILAALRKPAESSYRSCDFKNHLCFIPQRGLCEQKRSPEDVDDMSIIDSSVEFHLSDQSSKVAGVRCTTEGPPTTTALEPQMIDAHAEMTIPTGAVTPSETSEQTTAGSGRGSCDDDASLVCGAVVQHRESPRGDRAVMNERSEHNRNGSIKVGLDDFIPCLFYRWPLSDTLIVHFHGLDEDLGKTASYLERLHQQLEVNVLTMEYPGYGICGGLPRDPIDTNELFHERGFNSFFSEESPTLHQNEDSSLKRPQLEVLPQYRAPESVVHTRHVVGGQQAEILTDSACASYDKSKSACEQDAASFIRRGASPTDAGSATGEASKQINPSASADYRRIAASCRQLLLFVLKRLEVTPQRMFLSAVKLAAGLAIELCRFAEDLLGTDISLGGLILLQPLFVFPCSPSGTEPVSAEGREKTVSPRRPVRGVEAREDKGENEQGTSSQQTQKLLREKSLPGSKGHPAVAEGPYIPSTGAANFLPASQNEGWFERPKATKQNGHSHYVTENVGALPALEEMRTTSSLETAVELLQGCKEETCHNETTNQPEVIAAKEAPVYSLGEDNTRAFQLAVGTPPAGLGQNLSHADSFKPTHSDYNHSVRLKGAGSLSPADSVAKSSPLNGTGSTYRASGVRAAAGAELSVTNSSPHDQSMMSDSTVVPLSAFCRSQSRKEDMCTTCNTRVPHPDGICVPRPSTQHSSTSAESKNIQSTANGSSSSALYSENDDTGSHVNLNRLTLSTPPPPHDALVQSEQIDNSKVDRASGVVSATWTEGAEDASVSNPKSLYSPLKKTGSLPVSQNYGFDTTARSFFEQIRGLFLPSFTMVSESELEEGGRTAAIAQAALQLSRRKKLERLRRTAAALEGAFGMKQAVQRISAVKCPILFLAHRAVQPSHSSRARMASSRRSLDTDSGEDSVTDNSFTSLSSGESGTSASLSNPDVMDTLNRMHGEVESFLGYHNMAESPSEDDSVSADNSSLCTSTQETEHTEQCITDVRDTLNPVQGMPRTEFPGSRSNAQDVEEEVGAEKVVDGKTWLPKECSGFQQQRRGCRDDDVKVGKTRQQCTVPDERSYSFLRDNSVGTRSSVSKKNSRRHSRRINQKDTESRDDRVAEDIVVDRSIGLLMAHAGNSTKNEVYATFQLDNKLFSKVRAFIQRCKKTERYQQQLQQLAALRSPINLSSEKVAGSRCKIESSLEEKSQVCRRKEPVKKFISPTRLPERVKPGSRLVHTGNKTVCIPLELFRIPPPYKNREEALNRAYAEESLEDDDDREILIPEQSWFHKTLELCAKQLNLLAAAERAA